MQDTRQAQPPQFLELQAERPSSEADVIGNADDILERRALQRKTVLASQLGEVGAMAVEVGDHGERRQRAFGRFRLQNCRQLSAQPQIQPCDQVAHRQLPVRRKERIERPLNQSAAVDHDVGRKLHPRLKRHRFAVGRGGLLRQIDGDLVHGLVGSIEAGQPGELRRQIGRAYGRARDRLDHALVEAELLKGKRLVAQKHLIAGMNEAYGAAGAEKPGAQNRSFRYDVQQRHIVLDIAAHCRLKVGDCAIFGSRDHDLPLALGFRELLLDSGDIAIQLRQLHRAREGQLLQRAVELGQLAPEIGLGSLKRLKPSSLVEPVLIGGFELRLGHKAFFAQRLQSGETPFAEPNALALDTDLVGEMALLRPQRLDLRREVRRLLVKELLLHRLLVEQAGALPLQLTHDLFANRPGGLALQLCGEHQQRRTGRDRRALPHLYLGNDSLLRRGDPHHAEIRHEPSVDPLFARIEAEEQQGDHGQGRNARTGREHPVRYPGLQQDVAQPLGAKLLQRFRTKECRLPGSRPGSDGSALPFRHVAHRSQSAAAKSLVSKSRTSKLSSMARTSRGTRKTFLSLGSK